jgi:hypothetical protein
MYHFVWVNSIVEKPRATELLLKKWFKLQIQKMILKTFKGPIKKAEVEKSFNCHQGKHNKPDIKKGIHEYFYYLGSLTQALNYETTTEFIANYAKKTFEYGNDISMALKNLLPADKEVWKVSLDMSKADDQITKDQENKQCEMEFKLHYEEYWTQMKIYDNNLTKAYALIWEGCTKGMKHKIEARMEFTKNIKNNPIELLKAIREHSQNYQEHRYSMLIVLDSLRGLLATKQKEGETLQDWTKRFRIAREVLESHMGGPIVIDKCWRCIPHVHIILDISLRLYNRDKLQRYGKEFSST